MSRIGKQAIPMPSGVEAKIDGQKITIKGPKGQLVRELHSATSVQQEGNELRVSLKNTQGRSQPNFHGLSRSLVNNMVLGVSQGFSKSLTLIGVGYRAAIQGRNLQLTLGYSHPVVYEVPEGLEIKVEKQTTVVVSGFDKEKVGQAAADIRGFRKPEPYHGKGVRYSDEVIITKAGKSGKK
ncbi:MAG: 50S ribosomal protein L6 [Oligoflexales bacterium]